MTATTLPTIAPAPAPVSAAPALIMDRLRTETADLHRLAESCAFQKSLIRGVITPPMLARWFAQLLPVHRALEDHLAALRAASSAFAPFKDDQLRTPDLLADLPMLDPSMPPQTPGDAASAFLATLDRMAHGTQPEALLGVLYVLEGSNNGSRYIARALLRAWGWPEDRCPRFLNPYGERLPQRWQQFKNEMNAVDWQPAQQEAIICGAKAAFEAIHAMSMAMSPADALSAAH